MDLALAQMIKNLAISDIPKTSIDHSTISNTLSVQAVVKEVRVCVCVCVSRDLISHVRIPSKNLLHTHTQKKI